MTRTENLKMIKSACNKADPKKNESWYPRKYRLTDILAAIRVATGHDAVYVDQDGLFVKVNREYEYGWETFAKGEYETPPLWDIYQDDLDSQSDVTVAWIAENV